MKNIKLPLLLIILSLLTFSQCIYSLGKSRFAKDNEPEIKFECGEGQTPTWFQSMPNDTKEVMWIAGVSDPQFPGEYQQLMKSGENYLLEAVLRRLGVTLDLNSMNAEGSSRETGTHERMKEMAEEKVHYLSEKVVKLGSIKSQCIKDVKGKNGEDMQVMFMLMAFPMSQYNKAKANYKAYEQDLVNSAKNADDPLQREANLLALKALGYNGQSDGSVENHQPNTTVYQKQSTTTQPRINDTISRNTTTTTQYEWTYEKDPEYDVAEDEFGDLIEVNFLIIIEKSKKGRNIELESGIYYGDISINTNDLKIKGSKNRTVIFGDLLINGNNNKLEHIVVIGKIHIDGNDNKLENVFAGENLSINGNNNKIEKCEIGDNIYIDGNDNKIEDSCHFYGSVEDKSGKNKVKGKKNKDKKDKKWKSKKGHGKGKKHGHREDD